MHRRTYLVSIPDSRRKLCDHRNVICVCSLLCTTSHVMPMLLDVSVYRVMFMHATSPPTDRYPLLTTALRCGDEAGMHWDQLHVFHFCCTTYTVSLICGHRQIRATACICVCSTHEYISTRRQVPAAHDRDTRQRRGEDALESVVCISFRLPDIHRIVDSLYTCIYVLMRTSSAFSFIFCPPTHCVRFSVLCSYARGWFPRPPVAHGCGELSVCIHMYS